MNAIFVMLLGHAMFWATYFIQNLAEKIYKLDPNSKHPLMNLKTVWICPTNKYQHFGSYLLPCRRSTDYWSCYQ